MECRRNVGVGGRGGGGKDRTVNKAMGSETEEQNKEQQAAELMCVEEFEDEDL